MTVCKYIQPRSTVDVTPQQQSVDISVKWKNNQMFLCTLYTHDSSCYFLHENHVKHTYLAQEIP